VSEELDLSRKLADEGNYKKAVKSLAKVEYKARLYETEAEGMSELALLLRDTTSGSLRDECVRLHGVAQRYISQHQAERAERLNPSGAPLASEAPPQPWAPRHRPTGALCVMLAVGALYCWGYPAFHQGDEPGEPWDKGMVAGFWVQFALVSAILGFLWWKRVPWYVIVITPIPVAILGDPEATLANLNGNNDSLTYSDGRRAVLGWLPYYLVASLVYGAYLAAKWFRKR